MLDDFDVKDGVSGDLLHSVLGVQDDVLVLVFFELIDEAIHHQGEIEIADWLQDVTESADLISLDRVLGQGGHKNKNRVSVLLAKSFGRIVAVDFGHIDIKEDEIEVLFFVQKKLLAVQILVKLERDIVLKEKSGNVVL